MVLEDSLEVRNEVAKVESIHSVHDQGFFIQEELLCIGRVRDASLQLLPSFEFEPHQSSVLGLQLLFSLFYSTLQESAVLRERKSE